MTHRFLKTRSVYAGFFLTISSFSAFACSSSNSSSSNSAAIDCSTATVPTYSQVTGFQKCITCHSSTLTGAGRFDAPASINYDTYADAKAAAAEAVDEIESGSMPPAGSPALTEGEISALKLWASCSTPQ